MADITISNNNNPLNVFQPRFYVNLLEYASMIGEDIHPVHFYQNTEEFEFTELTIPLMKDLEYDFIMLYSDSLAENPNITTDVTGIDNIVNGTISANLNFDTNGVSIFKIDNIIDKDSITFISTSPFKLTNVIVGKIYDPPHAVDMTVKQGFDFSGVKNIYNKSGYKQYGWSY